MVELSWIALLLSVVLGVLPILATLRFNNVMNKLKARTYDGPSLRTALILPCKGLDQGFDENILSLFQQDYPQLEFVFVVATEDDPAAVALRSVIDTARSRGLENKVKVVVAGIEDCRSEKLTNQLEGLKRISPDIEVIFFTDSDIRPDTGFVRRMVAPLSSPNVGATTGYRWFHPADSRLGSILRSTWNAGALPLVADAKRSYAWGGAMAIRRETFERADIVGRWQGALSDDFPFTHGVHDLGLELQFVPSCIAISHEGSTLPDTLEFTNRQILISRVYSFNLWLTTALLFSIAIFSVLYGVVSAAAWFATGAQWSSIGSFCLLIVLLQMLNGALLLGSVKRLLPSIRGEMERLAFRYVATAPLAMILSFINCVHALTTRTVTWRGVRYTMLSPKKTIVTRGVAT